MPPEFTADTPNTDIVAESVACIRKNQAQAQGDNTLSNEGLRNHESENTTRQHYGAALVMESRGWYRDKFRQVVTICMITIAILTVSLCANLIQALSGADPVYLAVTDDLRLKQLTPLSEPAISQSALFNWTTRTITKTFSLDFVHWREQLMEVKPEFTDECFSQLVKSLQNAGNLDMIRQRRLVLSAVVKSAPTITAKGVVDGRMVWRLEFPISFSYESSERIVASQDLICTVMVKRVSVLDHPRGIRLAQIVLK